MLPASPIRAWRQIAATVCPASASNRRGMNMPVRRWSHSSAGHSASNSVAKQQPALAWSSGSSQAATPASYTPLSRVGGAECDDEGAEYG